MLALLETAGRSQAQPLPFLSAALLLGRRAPLRACPSRRAGSWPLAETQPKSEPRAGSERRAPMRADCESLTCCAKLAIIHHSYQRVILVVVLAFRRSHLNLPPLHNPIRALFGSWICALIGAFRVEPGSEARAEAGVEAGAGAGAGVGVCTLEATLSRPN